MIGREFPRQTADILFSLADSPESSGNNSLSPSLPS